MSKDIEFLTSKRVSEILTIHIRTVQRLTKEGKIKGIRIGKLFRYYKSDIERYLLLGIDFSKEPIRTPLDFNEQRAYLRINTNLICRYSIDLLPFKIINSQGIIKNISAGGVLLICNNNEIEIGDQINLEFMNIKTGGRIARRDRDGFGIKFRELQEEDKNKIIRYVG